MKPIKTNAQDGKLKLLYRKVFAPRQIIIRNGAKMRTMRLKSGFQATVSGFFLAVLVLSILSLYGYLNNIITVTVQRNALTTTQTKLSTMSDENAREQEKLRAAMESLSYYRAFLVALADQKIDGNADGNNGDGTLTKARLLKNVNALIETNQALDKKITALGVKPPDLGSITAVSKLVNDLPNIEQLDKRVLNSVQEMKINDLKTELDKTKRHNDQLVQIRESDRQSFDKAVADRKAAVIEREAALTKLVEAQKAVKLAKDSQKLTVVKLTARTNQVINNLEKVIQSTGMNLREIIPSKGAKGNSGGPFVPWDQKLPKSKASGEEMSQVFKGIDQQTRTAFESTLDRLERLNRFLSDVPFSKPLVNYSVTSLFGKRVDPFNDRVAKHEGIDLGAPIGSAVNATGAGVITWAGDRGAFGKLVEINHGYGITTRYAHLSKILVKVGDRVNLQQVIGLVGVTGRSQGPHLHYEVRVNGIARNPQNFLKANVNGL